MLKSNIAAFDNIFLSVATNMYLIANVRYVI